MLKRGVHHPDARAIYDGTILEDRVAFSLLRTAIPPSPAEILRFESIMRCLRLSGGIYRTTAAQRFRSLDSFLQPLIAVRFSGTDSLRVEDWAASACITSAEWFESLLPTFPALRMVASDLHLNLVEVLLPEGGSFVLEAEGGPLQYLKPPFVIPMHRSEGIRFPVNRWLQRKAQARFEELRQAGLLEFVSIDAGPDAWERPPLRFRKIPLVHPSAAALQTTSPQFCIESHSVFQPKAEANCNVIRTMNIFNRGYFPEERLLLGIHAVWQSLRTGGLWLVGRTVEEAPGRPQHATVFEKTATGFQLVARADAPSEIEDLAAGFRG